MAIWILWLRVFDKFDKGLYLQGILWMKDLSHLSFLSHLKFFFFHFALNSFVFVLVYFVFFAHRTSARLNLNRAFLRVLQTMSLVLCGPPIFSCLCCFHSHASCYQYQVSLGCNTALISSINKKNQFRNLSSLYWKQKAIKNVGEIEAGKLTPL